MQLLIDRNAAAGALVERSRAQGVVVGGGDDRLRLEYVSEVADVVVGDVVVTSGIDGIYPKGFVIGRVESVEKDGGSYKRITVKPAVDFSSLEEVLVVLTPTPAREAAEGVLRVKAAGVILAVAVALALQTTPRAFLVRGSVAVDLVLVVVVYVALTSGPATGLLTGTFAGLVQDALSSGVIGIGGLAKTIVGFLAGIIGTQFIVARRCRGSSCFSARRCCTRSCSSGCTCCSICGISARRTRRSPGRRPANAVVGVVAFQLVELLPGAVERRRAGEVPAAAVKS